MDGVEQVELTSEWEDACVWGRDAQVLVAEGGGVQRLKQRLTDEHSRSTTECAAHR